MADNLLLSTVPASGAALPAPPPVPEKFRDPQTGAVRVEALLKSYLELERRLSAAPAASEPQAPAPFDPAALDPVQLRRALGAPDTPEGYCVACDHGLFEPDAEINGRLFEAGYTPAQAQLLYDLAAERMMPLIQHLAAEFQAEREVERLVSRFGGEEKWREVSRQLLSWAGKNLPAAAVEGLSTTYEGVMALHSMMSGTEPAALSLPAGRASGGDGEAELRALMRDPRYWRERDPAVVGRVTEGFQRLYPSRG
ncbi:capsid assembly protein [Azospirillum doebereinerae]|uniref:Uncharacterized protein n=1 Tax=Azospirillum doebereinerae TaxID=92933 RepID=A0A3S0WYH4_9PROT|nr:hypothetical protein [Azospirillum doebereinerae]MCG5240134.1 hypothetical protein [Azospirillum doebereinerae]RUQ75954.1 hypothetical protein EJ913_02245 [Azospirillum doebereinerae]